MDAIIDYLNSIEGDLAYTKSQCQGARNIMLNHMTETWWGYICGFVINSPTGYYVIWKSWGYASALSAIVMNPRLIWSWQWVLDLVSIASSSSSSGFSISGISSSSVLGIDLFYSSTERFDYYPQYFANQRLWEGALLEDFFFFMNVFLQWRVALILDSLYMPMMTCFLVSTLVGMYSMG